MSKKENIFCIIMLAVWFAYIGFAIAGVINYQNAYYIILTLLVLTAILMALMFRNPQNP